VIHAVDVEEVADCGGKDGEPGDADPVARAVGGEWYAFGGEGDRQEQEPAKESDESDDRERAVARGHFFEEDGVEREDDNRGEHEQ